jgi:tetratricopeptide (TPR) repeat protein
MTDAPRRVATLATARAWCLSFGGQLHADTDEAWNTALRFAELSDDVGERLSVMCGMSLFLVTTGRLEQSIILLDDVVRIAAQAGDRTSLFEGERLRAMVEARRGNLVNAQTKLSGLADDLARGMPQSMHIRYQLQPYVSIHGTLAFLTWLTGQPERGLAMAEEIVTKIVRHGQLMGTSQVLKLVAMPLALWSGQVDTLERYSSILQGNLNHENIALWEQVHRFYASVGRHARGDLRAVDDMRLAIDDMARDRFLERTPMYLGVLAEALLERGRSADADEAMQRALMLQQKNEENWCLPELLRVKAHIIAARGERGHADAMLASARENATMIGARTLELRIVNDMAQMAIAEGDNEKAAELLTPLYGSFEDGIATEDLKRSRRLLAEVADAGPPRSARGIASLRSQTSGSERSDES